MRRRDLTYHGPTVAYEDLEHIAANMRELEKRDFLRHYDTVVQGLVSAVVLSGSSVRVVKYEGRPLAVFGVGEQLQQPWLAVTEELTRYPLLMVHEARDWVRLNAAKHPGMWNLVPCEDTPAVRLLQTVGFDVDLSTIHQNGGGDYYRFELRGEACA